MQVFLASSIPCGLRRTGGFAAEVNSAVAVADNYKGCELEYTAALNRLGYTVNGHATLG